MSRRERESRRPRGWSGLRPRGAQAGALRGAEELQHIGLAGEPRPGAVGLGDFLGARPKPGREKSEVGQRAADGGGLGVLEAGHRVHLTIADPLGRPAGGRRLAILGRAVDGGAEDDLLLGPLDQLGQDAAVGISLIEQLDPRGHWCVGLGIEIGCGLGHGRHDG